jgi:VanZ like family/Concanavalin A-like lectin/glucanases superfamily
MEIALAFHNLTRPPGPYRMKTLFWDVICLAVLCVILTLGLWPFHSPENEVSWLGIHNGLRFGRFGTVVSSAAFPMTSAGSEASGSVEVWLQPGRIWDQCTFLAFYTPGNPYQFSLRQSDAGLDLHAEVPGEGPSSNTASLHVSNVFRRPRRVFLTVTSGRNGTSVYTNGVLLRMAPELRLAPDAFTGRLVLGDSPGQPDSWSGELLGLAIYRRELDAPQVLRHYETWTQAGRPEIDEQDGHIALYLFNERSGRVVHDQAGSAVNLRIPEKYAVSEQIFLEPFWREFSLSRSYWGSAVKNIVGFVPFGFSFYACLAGRKVRRAALATVILGALVSLTIEILQAYLPTRDSGTTDLFTNTLGTYLGVLAYTLVIPLLAAWFPRLPSLLGGRPPEFH